MSPDRDQVPVVQRTVFDHVLTGIKASLASAPFGGGGAVLLDEYVTSSTKRSIEQANEHFSGRIKELGSRIETVEANADAIADAVKHYCRIVVSTSVEAKRRAAANILVNAMLRDDDADKLGFEELDHFARCVENLSAGAIALIGVAYDIVLARSTASDETTPNQRLMVRPPELEERAPDLNRNLLAGLICELDARALITLSRGPAYDRIEWDGGALSFRLTLLGMRFVEHVLGTTNSPAPNVGAIQPIAPATRPPT